MLPLAIISGKRYDELRDKEARLRRLERIVMMVEHVVGENLTRQILYRSPLGDIPYQLTYAGSGRPGNQLRLFGLDVLYLGDSGEGYDVVFMEP